MVDSPASPPPAPPPPASPVPPSLPLAAVAGFSVNRSSSVPRLGGASSQGGGGLSRAGSAGPPSSALKIPQELVVEKSGDGSVKGGEQQVNGHHVDIDKIIQMATSHSPRPNSAQPLSHPLRSGTPNSQHHHQQSQQGSMIQDTRMCLFVGNLPFRVRWQDVKDLFRRAGTVLRADVSLGSDNRSRGHGTVLMGSREDGLRAVEMFNGYNWQTRVLEVRPDRLPPEFELHAGQPPLLAPHPQQQQPPFHNSGPLHHPMGQTFSHPGSRSASPYFMNNGPPPPPNQGNHYGYPPPPPPLQYHPLAGPPPSSRPPGSSPPSSHPLVPASVTSIAALQGTTPPANASASLSTPTALTSALPTPPLSNSSSTTNHTPTNSTSSSLVAGSQLRNASKSPVEGGGVTTGGGRAAPPPPLGALPPPPAFGQVGHGMQQVYSQQNQGGERISPSAALRLGSGNLAGRVLFVGNLPYHIQWQDLKDLFRTAGNIIRADVVLGPDGRSKGIGHVLFATEEDAARGITMFDGTEFNGRILQVRHETNVVAPGPLPPRQPPPHQYPQQQQRQQYQPQQSYQQQQQQQHYPMPSPHQQLPNMNFPLYGYEPPSPFHAPPSPFYPPPSPFHAPFQYHHHQQAPPPTEQSTIKEGEVAPAGGEARTPPARGGGGAQHAHPGPISLPPAYPAFGGGGGGSGPGSPMLGRNGMPMMTPSMPAFQFGAPFQMPQTPEFYPHAFLSPGLGPMSPDPSSPSHPNPHHSSTFYHHHTHNPFLNPAPGAPISRFPNQPNASNQNGGGGFQNFDNPMFPSSPGGYQPNSNGRLHQRMETPGAVYFPGGGGPGFRERERSSFGAVFEGELNEVNEGKTPPAGGRPPALSGGSGGGGGGEGYPFPELVDVRAGGVEPGEGETPGIEELVEGLRIVTVPDEAEVVVDGGERPKSGAGGGEVGEGGGGERPGMGARSLSRRNSGGGA